MLTGMTDNQAILAQTESSFAETALLLMAIVMIAYYFHTKYKIKNRNNEL